MFGNNSYGTMAYGQTSGSFSLADLYDKYSPVLIDFKNLVLPKIINLFSMTSQRPSISALSSNRVPMFINRQLSNSNKTRATLTTNIKPKII
jgi:hypothetical protein